MAFIGTALFCLIQQIPLALTGLLATIAIVILPTRLSNALLWQCGLMMGVGIGLLVWMHFLGDDILWYESLNSNVPLLILFASVSFLRVLPVTPSDGKSRKGVGAFVQTLLGTHFLASVINMSASVVVANYLKGDKTLNQALTLLTMRSVCIAAYWSPFFGAMATVLHYMPDVQLPHLWIYSVPLTLFALALTTFEAKSAAPDKLAEFKAYPIGLEPLLLPIGLLISSLIAHQLWPDIPMVLLVSMAALLLPCLLLLYQKGGKDSLKLITKHIGFGLGNLRGEFLLFISAGVLGSGGSALLKHFPPALPFEVFDAGVASLLLILILSLAMLGAHTIVGIAISAPIVLSTDPNITLLSLCYLSAWSIAAVMSPFSGLSLFFKGHYQLSMKQLLDYHWKYGIIMTLASIVMFHLTGQSLET